LKHRLAATWAVLILLVLIAGFAALASRPAIHPIEAPKASAFDKASVVRGANLAAIGNCSICHTAENGRALAGGRGLGTPFGLIYSTNITPDPMTGIGQWSEQAFARAMREGVSREGEHLYPAFPYDHFTLMSDEDIHDLYAYLMTREPVRARAPANELPFPLGVRDLLAAWKALFFRTGRFRPDPNHDVTWNRGAYLVEGVGHCGACHTPRNVLGAEKKRHMLTGGKVEGWIAYALDGSSPAPVAWNADSLAFYLRHGWHGRHGIARGPMSDVTSSLATVQERDVRAIATYIASRMQGASDEARPAETSQSDTPESDEHRLGAAVYESTCANCHSGARPPPFGGIDFTLSTAIHAPNPRNIINVTLHGLHGPPGDPAPIMPGFDATLSDEQLEALLVYLRARFSDKPPWSNLAREIEAGRNAEMEEGGSWP
jgi:mono/diheme cytochrome c family protein